METIEVCSYVHAPIEKVWAALTEHERYDRFEGCHGVHMAALGSPHPNGVGAKRVVDIGVKLTELIEEFEEPTLMRYRIIDSSIPLPFEHLGGEMRFTRRGEGTEVHWVSRFAAKLPLLERALGPVTRMTFTEAFQKMLLQVKRELE